jgi:hypothetical protein
MSALLVAIRALLAQIVAWLGVNVINGATRLAVSVAVLLAWSVFLGVVTTQMTAMGMFEILTTNPLSGLPHDMFVLFCAVFPFGFFVRLVIAYILWNLSVQQAALVMNKVTRMIFGG